MADRAAFTFTIALPGLPALAIGLSRLREDISDWRPFWRDRFVPSFRRQVLEDFVSEGSHSGSRWAALSPAYAAWKRKHAPGKGILVFSGALKASLTSNAAGSIVRLTETTADVGTSVPHAIFHQLGTRKLKQRPPLRITQAYLTAIGADMNRWIETLRQQRLAGLKAS